MSGTNRVFVVGGLVLFLAGFTGPGFAQTFSLDPTSPTGAPPDDMLTPGPFPFVPGIGSLNVDGHSFSHTLGTWESGFVGAYFSVDRFGIGQPLTAVNVEAGAPTPGPDFNQSADIFSASLPPPGGPFSLSNANALYSDGDGSTPSPNGSLGLIETAPGPPVNDDLDALDIRLPGLVSGLVWYSLDSATAGAGGATSGADILLSAIAPAYDSPPATVWATAMMLGLSTDDDIDALVTILGDGDLDFDLATDIAVFSLAPLSPYLGTLDPFGSGLRINEGDVLAIGSGLPGVAPGILVPAEDLGLTTFRTYGTTDDNLNALDLLFQFQIPEPGTVAFLVSGLLLLGLWRRPSC